MPKPYDAALKDMLTRRPADWVPLVSDRVPDRVELLDTDVSQVSAATDKLIRVSDPDPWLLQLEFQSSYLADLDARTHWYNAVIGYAHGLPVVSLVVLLHRRADSPRWTGRYERRGPRGDVYLDFRYRVLRAWELRVEQTLHGPLGLVPLTLLTDEAQADLPGTVDRMDERFRAEVDANTVADLWAIAGTLSGLRIDKPYVSQLLGRFTQMEESSFVKWWEEVFSIREARKALLMVAGERFGEPDPETRRQLEAIEDLGRLEDMIRRAVRAPDWAAVLAGSEPVAT